MTRRLLRMLGLVCLALGLAGCAARDVAYGEAGGQTLRLDAQKLDAALRRAGVESQLLEFADEGHALAKPENTDRALRAMMAFLKKHLSP